MDKLVLPSHSEHGIVTTVVASMVSVRDEEGRTTRLVVTGVMTMLLTTIDGVLVDSATGEDEMRELLMTGLMATEEVSDVLGHNVVVVYVMTWVMVTGET